MLHKIILPTKKSEVTVETFQKYHEMCKNAPRQIKRVVDMLHNGNWKYADMENLYKEIDSVEWYEKDLPFMVEILELFCGVNLGDRAYRNIVEKEFNCILRLMTSIVEPKEYPTSIELDGEVFYLPTIDLKDEVIGGYMACQNLCQDVIPNLHTLMAYLCRPEGERFDEKVTISRALLFKQMDLQSALDISFFLLKLVQYLNQNFKNSSKTMSLGRLQRGISGKDMENTKLS